MNRGDEKTLAVPLAGDLGDANRIENPLLTTNSA